MAIKVMRIGRTYGVYVDGDLAEGGFFARSAAEATAALIRAERFERAEQARKGAK